MEIDFKYDTDNFLLQSFGALIINMLNEESASARYNIDKVIIKVLTIIR